MFYGWIIVAVTWVIYFTNVGMFLYGASPINALMMNETGFTEATIGLAVAVCTACQGAFSPITGRLTRKYGVKGLFLAGSLLLFAGSLVLSFWTLHGALFVVIYGFVFGLGMTMGGILTCQSVLNNWFQQKKGLAFSIALSAGGVSGFVAPLIVQAIIGTGTIGVTGSWHKGWRLIAAMCVVSALASLFLMVDRPADRGLYPDGALSPPPDIPEAERRSVAEVFRSKKIYVLISGIVTRYMLYYAVLGHLVVYLVQHGVERGIAVGAFSIMSLAGLGGRFLPGIIGDKIIFGKIVITNKHFLMSGNFIGAAGLLALIVFPGAAGMYVGASLVGIGNGVGYIAQPIVIANEYGVRDFPVINGYIYPANYIIGALGPLIAGFGATLGGSYTPVFFVLAVIGAVGGVALKFV
jgi:MFS family permease